MKARLYLLLCLAAFWAVGIGLRLYELQILDHDRYAERAGRQHHRVVEVDPPRGTIYDARGRELAVSLEVESAFASPRDVQDAAKAARALGPVLGDSVDDLERRLSGSGSFVWLERKLAPAQVDAIRALDLEGIHFLKEYKRFYPLDKLAASVLGFVGVDNQGLSGLEFFYDRQIAGQKGRRTVVRDARHGTLVLPTQPDAGAVPGADLYLSLDASMQFLAEKELARAVVEQRARSGSVILLDPADGGILAMATYPPDRQHNPPVMDVYEPGSTFKLITAAAALERNLVDPSDLIDCGMGRIVVRGKEIRDHKPFGDLTFRQVIAKSSNVGIIKTGMKLRPEEFFAAIRAFGFGRPTGIDLPGESPGLLRPLEEWQPVTPAYISFGQGIAVTAIQLAGAFAAVANGGTLYRPHVVSALGRNGEVIAREVEPVGYPLAPSTARELGRMLEGVVEKGGTATAAGIPEYRVAGKTGTAQTAEPGQGYSSSRFVPSFVGYAPARQPVVVGLVVIDSPQAGLIGGGAVAAPVFARIVERVLLYLGEPIEHRPAPEFWPRQVVTVDPSTPRPEGTISENAASQGGLRATG